MRKLRKQSGMTQEQISKELNISRQVYSYYETGHRIPDLDTACRIAKYHKITIDRLIGGIHTIPEENFTFLPEDYQELLAFYQKLSPESRKSVKDFTKFLASKI